MVIITATGNHLLWLSYTAQKLEGLEAAAEVLEAVTVAVVKVDDDALICEEDPSLVRLDCDAAVTLVAKLTEVVLTRPETMAVVEETSVDTETERLVGDEDVADALDSVAALGMLGAIVE